MSGGHCLGRGRVQISKAASRRGVGLLVFAQQKWTVISESQYAGGILLQPVQKLVATLIFARPPQGQKCKRVPSGVFIHPR